MVSEGEEEYSEGSKRRNEASQSGNRKFLSEEPVSNTPRENSNKSVRGKCRSVEPTPKDQIEQSSRSQRSARYPEEASERPCKRSENSEKESRSCSPEDLRKKRSKRKSKRSRRRSKKSRTHKCSMLCNQCPDNITHKDLTRAAAADRERRERITVRKMIEEHGMNEVMLLTAMKRQSSYSTTRGMALYLQCFCVIGCGIMAILAQRVFNTRGELNFYLCEMTFELFLLFVALCNVVAPSHISRFFNVIIFILAVGVNFSHLLIVARSEGLFWKCMQGDVVMQHCFLFTIPSHYHTLYTAGFLMFIHIAIALLSVATTIFYDGSLDWHIDETPGAPQWITSEPLHRHQRFDEARALKKKQNLIKKLSQSKLKMSDLPPGTTITREQSEQSVKTTTYDRLGRANVGPEHVTMSRSYTLKAPGSKPVTSKRKWVVRRPPTGSSFVPAKDVKTTPVPDKMMSNNAEVTTARQPEISKETSTTLEGRLKPTGKPIRMEDQSSKPIGKPIKIEDYPEMKSNQSKPYGKPVEIPSDMKPLEQRVIEDSGAIPGQLKPIGKPVEIPSDMKPIEKRDTAGREEVHDDSPLRITRMPALISPLAYLANKNKDNMEKQSDYMY